MNDDAKVSPAMQRALDEGAKLVPADGARSYVGPNPKVAQAEANVPGRAPTAQEIIESQVRQVLGITLRGLLVSAPGIPPHVLLNAICRQAGALVSQTVDADVAMLVNLRKGFTDAFQDGVRSVPLMRPQGPAPRMPS